MGLEDLLAQARSRFITEPEEEDPTRSPLLGTLLSLAAQPQPQPTRRRAPPAGGGPSDPGLEPLLQKLQNRLPWLDIVSGYRTRAEQAALYKQKPDLAAPPGHSFHEVGGALDVHSEDINRLVKWLAKHPRFGNRIYRPMDYEPWHFQLRGERERYL